MINKKNSDVKLNVVIVSYNSADTILKTLESLHSLVKDKYLDVTVVDNHGNDGVAELLAEKCNWVEVLHMSQNLGFGYGCNAGFYNKNSEYTLFLNPDAIIKPDSIYHLVDFLDGHLDTAAVAPAIFEGKQMQLAGLMPKSILLKNSRKDISGPRIIKPNEVAFKTSWLCGAVLMVRSSCFDEVGGFDEKFFLYFEETDLCKRLSDSGYDLWANGLATANHIGGGSTRKNNMLMVSGCIAEHFYQSRYYYFKKHYGIVTAVTYELSDFMLICMVAVKTILTGRKEAITSFWVRIKSPFFSEPR